MRKLLEMLIRFQSAVPFTLPNEKLVWKQYNKNFSKTCDICHDNKGVYEITGQDPTEPRTVLIPIAVRMCADCMCRADERVGIMSEKEEEGQSMEIERV